MDDLETHRVGVVVFMEVQAIDRADADGVAARLVRDKLADGLKNPLPVPLSIVRSGDTLDGTVVKIMEVSMAVGNGYLATEVTGRAYRQ